MSTTPPILKIHLLGSFRVILNDEAITNFDADSARALLAYLVLRVEHAHERVSLASLLWCDQPVESGLHNLRSALNRLRKALNDSDALAQPLILATRRTVQWNPKYKIWVDVLEFERLLALVKRHAHRRLSGCPWCIQQLAQLAALYDGEFLTDLRVESLLFEEWRQVRRESMHRLAMQSFHVLAEHHQQKESYGEAEFYARRQIALERWNEEAHVQLMRALYATGQRSAALAQYEACRGILEAEFGVAPVQSTTVLYAEICQRDRQERRQPILAFAPANSPMTSPSQPCLHNLPQPLTSFVNRQTEVDILLQGLVNPAQRLTTLTGGGGMGKTRLALSIGQTLKHSFADGVWFVSLAELPSTTEKARAETAIAEQICRVLPIDNGARGTPRQHLLTYLRGQEMLLILDNFEHVAAGAALIHSMLQAAPSISLLVTSRHALGFQAEQLMRVPALTQIHAVQLFLERARAFCPDWRATAEQMPLVEEICFYVGGCPLAIELAAAGLRQQSLAAICQLTKHRSCDLAADLPDIPVRHRSLRAVFAHSWQLLTAVERQALKFMAGVANISDITAAQLETNLSMSVLANLYHKSMIMRDGEERFYVPAITRTFVTTGVEGCAGE
ncbi:MAG: BTAD domain-containing putative transcriptional regulator [Caldilineaceae bacterium]